jgi:hypothetical protein
LKDSEQNPANNLVRLGAMDSAELLERARYYQRLADGADEQIRDELLYLAEQYEAMARELERTGQNSE